MANAGMKMGDGKAVQVNVRISEDLKKRVEHRCTDEDTTYQDLIAGFLESWATETAPLAVPVANEQERQVALKLLAWWRSPRNDAHRDVRNMICTWLRIPEPQE